VSEAADEAFNRLWSECAPRVMAYALRHVDHDQAQEVVSDTFLVAWRRLAEVPEAALPWLLVVARNTIANSRRSGRRRAALQAEAERLHHLAEPAPAAEVSALERTETLERLAALRPADREALLLVAWDGLTPAQAARVAGCGLAAFHVRLHRARRRLSRADDAGDAGIRDAGEQRFAVRARDNGPAARACRREENA
jgi:RNA polymerase sigma-70 factor, ECF subfamily